MTISCVSYDNWYWQQLSQLGNDNQSQSTGGNRTTNASPPSIGGADFLGAMLCFIAIPDWC